MSPSSIRSSHEEAAKRTIQTNPVEISFRGHSLMVSISSDFLEKGIEEGDLHNVQVVCLRNDLQKVPRIEEDRAKIRGADFVLERIETKPATYVMDFRRC